MRRYRKQGVALLTAAMIISLLGCNQAVNVREKSEPLSETESKLEEVVSEKVEAKNSEDNGKEETVYVTANPDGSTKKVIVSNWLKNGDKKDSIEDETTLTDVENVKGDETFKQDGDKITWAADGNDIYYKGTSNEELPVTMKISYKLDGKDISAKDLAGKSGKITIRFDYINNSKEKGVYTPFLMVSGMILDGEKFTNIETTNGKVVSDGNNNVVVGMSFPGLKESLDLKSIADEDVNIPEYFEVKADVEDFSLAMTMTMASSDFLGEMSGEDNNVENVLSKIDDKVTEFQDGVSALTDGASALNEGATTLNSGVNQYTTGVNTLASGIDTLSTGASQVSTGASKLQSGINTAKAGVDTIVTGYEGDRGAVSGSKQIADGLTALNNSLAGFTLPTQVELTPEQQAGLQALITQKCTENITSKVQAYAAEGTHTPEEIMAYQSVLTETYVAAYQAGVQQGSSMVMDGLSAYGTQIDTLKSSVSALSKGANGLYAGINQLYSGSVQLQTGLTDLSTGSASLATGASQVNTGAKTLDTGAATLKNSSTSLVEGTGKLLEGTATLSEGTVKLSDGTSELVDKVTTLKNNVKKVIDAGKAYNTFSGVSDNMDSSVKFIIETSAIEK